MLAEHFDWIHSGSAWMGLLTLTALEIVLGIDNIVFISILAGKLPSPEERERARKMGLLIALVSRILLVMSAAWIVKLTYPVFTLPFAMPGDAEHARHAAEISWKDMILIGGGAFLVWKATHEIHKKLEGEEESHDATVKPKLSAILTQILLLDVVFSIDSVITAVGMVGEVAIMIIAVVAAVGFMLLYSGPIAGYVEKHPTIKVLALSFLILIGVSLIAEGFEQGIPKAYIYFSMAFAVVVEVLNLRVRKKHA